MALLTAFLYALSNVLELTEAEKVPDEYALGPGLVGRPVTGRSRPASAQFGQAGCACGSRGQAVHRVPPNGDSTDGEVALPSSIETHRPAMVHAVGGSAAGLRRQPAGWSPGHLARLGDAGAAAVGDGELVTTPSRPTRPLWYLSLGPVLGSELGAEQRVGPLQHLC